MSKIKIGDYVIINEFDRPCTRLISQITSINGNDVHACYICSVTNMIKCSGFLSDVTLVSDFGVELTFKDGYVWAEQTSPSIATYRDGKFRDWRQPSYEDQYEKLRVF